MLIMTTTTLDTTTLPAHWRDFVALTKPRVMSLVVFTGLAGCSPLRAPSIRCSAFTAILCIALGAAPPPRSTCGTRPISTR
jgi:protoheme IX farnesyltransferase